MDFDRHVDDFIKTPKYDKALKKTAKQLLTGTRNSDLPQQPDHENPEYLGINIQNSVKMLLRGKDTAITVYKRFVQYLKKIGIPMEVTFPPIPIDNSFERQMFIAKYLQGKNSKISDLEDILWVSERTISQDLQRLYRDSDDPIQVCGRPFFIPDSVRSRGQMHSASTVHPFFLIQNLTQVIVMLKGLHKMAEDPLYTQYARASAAEIWEQLSDYARNRIRFVLGELLPEDLSWYENLETGDNRFSTEQDCSVNGNVWIDCIKNDKPFFVEYQEDSGVVFYEDCHFVPKSYNQNEYNITIEVECRQGRKKLVSERVLRSAYTIEELLSD